jgi:tryptophan synthase alpha chain
MKVDKVINKSAGILNIFYTAGYPHLNSTVEIARYLDKTGVELVEIGMPYSDPLADGKIIQHSSEVALENGMNLEIMFKQVSEISATTRLTIILMGYLNQVMTFGVEKFLNNCQATGVSGLIIPDLPLDIYQAEYKALFQRYQVDISFLITPRTSDERIKLADSLSSGFLYLVSDNSLTGGASDKFSQAQMAYFTRVNKMRLSSPKLIGFGIKTANQYKQTKKLANGAIIGSYFIEMLTNADQINQESISAFVSSIVND